MHNDQIAPITFELLRHQQTLITNIENIFYNNYGNICVLIYTDYHKHKIIRSTKTDMFDVKKMKEDITGINK